MATNDATTALSPAPSAETTRTITVFESTDVYNIKHPLQFGWSLWLKKPDNQGHGNRDRGHHDHGKAAPAAEDKPKSSLEIWMEQVDHIGTVHTVEDFWWYALMLFDYFSLMPVFSVVNNIPSVNQLQNQSDYFFFREGIAPMWEDEANVGGGMFQLTMASSGGGGNRDGPRDGPRKTLDWDALWLNAVISCTIIKPLNAICV